MAILYKNVKKKLQTDTTILTPANATTAIIKSIVVCEQSNNSETLNVTITDTADTPVTFQVFKDKSISAKATVELLTEPLILAELETLKATGAVNDRLHMVVSYQEIS
tara:strand:- start:917 stop:1240 length:324 start_codon:yes stop_codon:yes gene_type:complete